MFGIGYASAEDRLFFIDALRHAGEGDLAQFAGGANAAMDAQVWASEPYTQQDLVNQVQYGLAHSKDGPQILSDATNYVAGINAYIGKAQNPLFTGTMMPAETAFLASPSPTRPLAAVWAVSALAPIRSKACLPEPPMSTDTFVPPAEMICGFPSGPKTSGASGCTP